MKITVVPASEKGLVYTGTDTHGEVGGWAFPGSVSSE